MGITHITLLAAFSLSGFLPAGCHKSKPVAPVTGITTGVTNGVRHHLGEVQLTNHSDTLIHLGEGKDCILTPKSVAGRDLQITVAFESKNPGKASDLSVTQISAKDGKPVEAVVGDFPISFTPRMAE